MSPPPSLGAAGAAGTIARGAKAAQTRAVLLNIVLLPTRAGTADGTAALQGEVTGENKSDDTIKEKHAARLNIHGTVVVSTRIEDSGS